MAIVFNVLKLTAQTPCPNLVANSDFESGNSAFTSALTSNPSCVLNTYVVSTNFNLKCTNFPNYTDHTTGKGKFLIVQNSTAVNVWATNVTVVPNTPYTFSFWLANAVTNTMTYAIIVNGINVNQFTATQATPTWTKYTFTGVCPAGVTSLPIAIKQITFGEAYTFGIDDISFSSCGCQAAFNITSLGCGHYQVINTSTGTQPITYKWCNGASTPNLDVQFDSCGKHDFCLTMTDATGCTSTVTQSVTVADNIPPVALCKPGVGVILDPTTCVFAVTPAFVDGGSTDNCKIKSLSVNPTSLSGCGLNTVTLTVTDWCDNKSTCTMGIQTQESVPPTIVCPPGFSANCNLNVGPNITGVATATDNCTASIKIVITSTDLIFGTIDCDDHIERTWSAKDLCGNISKCKQFISVKDNLPPVISNCPQNMSVLGTIGANGVCTANVSFIKPTATDNCTPSVSVTNNAPTVFPLGTTTVIWTATDNCGNKSTCNTVVDVKCQAVDSCRCGGFSNMTFRPTQGGQTSNVKCGDTLTIPCSAQFNPIIGGLFNCLGNCTGTVNYELIQKSTGSLVASGNLTVPSFSLSLLLSNLTQSGLYELTFSGQCGGQKCEQCKFFIKVLPAVNAAFTITSIGSCGHYQVVSTSTGAQPIIYKWCNGAVTPNTDFQFDTCGKQDICLTVTDANGCTSSLTQSVTVIDTTPPKAICKPGVGVVLDANCAFAVSPAFVDGGSTDNCKIKSLSVSPTSISGCGNTNITLTVTDWCGNMSTCTMGIQTIESVPPTIVCPPSFSANCNLNVGPNITGTATATDNCTAAINIKITSSDLVVGTIGCDDHIERTWSAKDLCGNVSTCKQFISVKDNLPPVISNCPPNMSVIGTIGANGVCTANVSFIKPTATDNCTASVTLTNNAPAIFPSGTTTVTWTATDDCGNKSTCITVIDVKCQATDSCRCGGFSNMTFRPTQGGQTSNVKCGDTLTFACNTQFNPIIGGLFSCLGNCTGTVDYNLNQSSGLITSGILTAPNFSLTLLSSYVLKPGFYELTFHGQCGAQKCEICKFIIKVLPAVNINFGLTGYFPFAGNANDVSPSTTLVNGIPTSVTLTTSSNGIPNTAYNFNGTTSWIDCTNGTRGVVDKVSVCAWVKTSEKNNGMWVAGQYDGPSQGKGYILSIGGFPKANIGLPEFSGRVIPSGGYYAAISTGKKVNDGNWHCIIGTAGSGEWKIYIDGVLSGSDIGSTTPSIVGNTKSFTIARHSDGALNTDAFYNGDMDEVRVYNRVLTQCEIDSICSVNIFTGVKDANNKMQIQIYPNPNLGTFTIEFQQPTVSNMMFRITDIIGRVITEKPIEKGSEQQTVGANNLNNGLYLLQIVQEGRVVATEKFVKE